MVGSFLLIFGNWNKVASHRCKWYRFHMGISSAEFERFLKAVLPGMGLNWRRYLRRNIRRRLLHRLDTLGMISVSQYEDTIQSDQREFQIFYNILTITVSRFFRNRSTYERIRQEVLPDIVTRDGRLNVWSIGCASGEEPYSIAILWDAYLKEKYPDMKPAIIATDIDLDCLKRAERAVYEKGSLRELPKELLERYFVHERCHFMLAEGIKRMAEFSFHDLLKDKPFRGNNLVLCRNLAFTYFGVELQKKIIDKIHESLEKGGYLIIGRKEALPENTLFEPVYPMDGIYKRAEDC